MNELLQRRPLDDRIPDKSRHSGECLDGFEIRTASDIETARAAIRHAIAARCNGGEYYITEQGTNTLLHWAIVERLVA